MDSRRLVPLAFALLWACAESTSPPPPPASVGLDDHTIVLDLGDSVMVEARALDADSMGRAADIAWTVSDTAVVRVVRVETDSTGTISRATLLAQGVAGEVVVRAGGGGVGDSAVAWAMARHALPPGYTSLSGPMVPDTLDGVAFAAQDTLLIRAPPFMRFRTWATAAMAGRTAVLRRTDSTLLVVTNRPFAGRPRISGAYYVFPTTTFDVSPYADSVRIAKARYRGTITADSSAVGARTLLRLQMTGPYRWVNTSMRARFGTNALPPYSWATTEVVAQSDSGYGSGLNLWGVSIYGVQLDSLVPVANVTVNAPTLALPFSVGAGRLVDTVRVYTIPGVVFGNPPYSGSRPYLDVAGVFALADSSAADSVWGLAPRAGAWQVSVRNVQVNGTLWYRVFVPGLVTWDQAVTGEPDEPANDAAAGATALPVPSDRVGAVSATADHDDWFTFTLAAPAAVTLSLEYAGDRLGSPGNPHLDLWLYRSPCGAADLRRGTVESYGDVITDDLPAGAWCVRVSGGPGADRLHTYVLRLR